jgi:hypothetical protein
MTMLKRSKRVVSLVNPWTFLKTVGNRIYRHAIIPDAHRAGGVTGIQQDPLAILENI